jgi:hypothetical protein
MPDELALVTIEGNFGVTAAPGGRRDRDHYDFAFCSISDETGGKLAGPSSAACASAMIGATDAE